MRRFVKEFIQQTKAAFSSDELFATDDGGIYIFKEDAEIFYILVFDLFYGGRDFRIWCGVGCVSDDLRLSDDGVGIPDRIMYTTLDMYTNNTRGQRFSNWVGSREDMSQKYTSRTIRKAIDTNFVRLCFMRTRSRGTLAP